MGGVYRPREEELTEKSPTLPRLGAETQLLSEGFGGAGSGTNCFACERANVGAGLQFRGRLGAPCVDRS